MAQNIEKFGDETMSRYINHLKLHYISRRNSDVLYKRFKDHLKSPFTASMAAVGYAGLGECGEKSNVALVELGLMGCPIGH